MSELDPALDQLVAFVDQDERIALQAIERGEFLRTDPRERVRLAARTRLLLQEHTPFVQSGMKMCSRCSSEVRIVRHFVPWPCDPLLLVASIYEGLA